MNTAPAQNTHENEPRAQEIRRIVQRVQSRLRLRDFASLVPVAVSLALAAAILLAALGRFREGLGPMRVLEAAAFLVISALFTVAAYAALRPRDLMLTARRADRLLGLDERLSTALEDIANEPTNPSPQQAILRDAQLDDALASVRVVDLRRDLPLQIQQRAGWLPLALLAVLFLSLFVPIPGTGPSPQQQAATAQLQNERKEIELLKKALQSQTAVPNNATNQATQKELDDLLRDLGKEGLSRDKALSRLSEAQSKLEKGLDPQSSAKREALDALARQLEQSGNEAAREAADALKSNDSSKAADALEKAGEQAASLSPEQRKALADELRKARDNTAPLDPELANRLDEAAKALDSNDPQAAKDALKNLGQSVEQKQQELATQQQISQSLAQLQQSKENLAQAGQPTPANSAGAVGTNITQSDNQTPNSANSTVGVGIPSNGSPVSGTTVASLGRPVALAGSPLAGTQTPGGTPVALGSPVKGQLSQTGTPVVAQAQGRGQSGQGSSPGQGSGSVQQPGSGGSGSQSGQGGQGGQSGNGSPSGSPGGGAGHGHTDPVYAPGPGVNAASTAVAVKGQNNPGGEQSSTTANTDANNTGASQVPYDQVYGQYRESAGKALDSDYIPQGYKDLVKDYFSSIEPQR